MGKRIGMNLLAILVSFVLYYFMLPAFNIHNIELYGYLFIVVSIFAFVNFNQSG